MTNKDLVNILGVTPLDHTEIVRALCKPGITIRNDLTPEDCHLLHMVLGIAGEAGEILDAVKKKVIYRKDLDTDNIIEELGDIEFYLEGLRQALNIKRTCVLQANIDKLSVRYGETFLYSDKAAVERKDKK